MKKQDDRSIYTVYTPESQLQSPLTLLRSMWHDLKASRELAWRLTVRDINARYRQSILGVLWAFLPPLATAGTFIFLNSEGIVNVGTTKIPYVAFALFGTVLWQFFTECITTPLKVVTTNKLMLAHINFPREALILSAIGQVLFNFCMRLVILVAVFVIFHLQPTWGLLLAPLAMLMLMLLGILIGIILTPIGMLYADVKEGIALILPLGLLLTPVVYTTPEQGILAVLAKINPVSPILMAARDLATVGTMTDLISFLIISGITILGLLVMWVVYRVSIPILTERIGA